MTSDQLMTLEEVAEFIRTPEATLRFWRHRGEYGPRSAKVGRRVMYRKSDVDRWLAEQFDHAASS